MHHDLGWLIVTGAVQTSTAKLNKTSGVELAYIHCTCSRPQEYQGSRVAADH